MNAFDELTRASTQRGLGRRRLLQASVTTFAMALFAPSKPGPAQRTSVTAREAATCPGGVIDWYPGCTNPQPKQGYVNSYNGCGPANGWLRKVLPDFPTGANLRAACNEHDLCYGTCGADKGNCDNAFLTGNLKACQSQWGGGKGIGGGMMLAICNTVANDYWAAVTLGGKSAFNAAQTAACDCCPGCEPGEIACGEWCCPSGKVCCNGSCINAGDICCTAEDYGYGCDPWRVCCPCPDNANPPCCCCPDSICTPSGCLGGTGCA